MRRFGTNLSLMGALLLFSGPALARNSDVITFKGDTIYPESVSWSQDRKRFFVGSVRHGVIGTVDANGAYRAFVTDPALISTFGVRVDDKHKRVWVTTADFGVGDRSTPGTKDKLAAVAVYNLATGKRIGYYDIAAIGAGRRLANDIAVDPAGNAYVTDSFAQVVYRIDLAGRIKVFAEGPLLKTGESIGANGIAYHPDGYLLVGAWDSGEILRISLTDPTQIVKVDIPVKLKGLDGITLLSPTQLVGTVNAGDPSVVAIESTDGWMTARVVAKNPPVNSFPSSVTVRNKDAWALNARMDTLIDPKARKVDTFTLQRFDFGKIR